MTRFSSMLAAFLLIAGCGSQSSPTGESAAEAQTRPAAKAGQSARRDTAVFAGGCFWCTESDFEKVPGVISAVSGYVGGRTANPTYEKVTAGGTGHYEAVRIVYDPARVTYQQLARRFFRSVDPTDAGGQFCDRGDSYRTAIFVFNPEQKRVADAAKAEANRVLRGRVVTPILPTSRFYPAEDYHQDYYRKNPIRYRYYRSRCGRDTRLTEVWGAQAAR